MPVRAHGKRNKPAGQKKKPASGDSAIKKRRSARCTKLVCVAEYRRVQHLHTWCLRVFTPPPPLPIATPLLGQAGAFQAWRERLTNATVEEVASYFLRSPHEELDVSPGSWLDACHEIYSTFLGLVFPNDGGPEA